MKKALVLIILTVAVVVGGVKGFIYYKVTTQLDDAIQAVSPFVSISYEDVSSSLDGEVTVGGVKVKAYGDGLALAIDEVGVKFQNLQTLLFIGDDLKKQRVPEQMGLSLRHVRMDLQNLQPYLEMAKAQSGQPLRDYSLLGCGELEQADPLKVLQALGYSELDSSMTMGYRWDRASKRLTINSDFSWHELTRSAMTIQLDQIATLSAAAMFSEPELKLISVSVEDEGYNARLVEHCAASQNINNDEFITIHMAALRTALGEQGITLGENLFDAYNYYLQSKGELMFQMRPGSLQQLSNLDMYKPRDIPGLLDLEIHMGDTVIRDIEFDWDERKFKQTMAALVEQPQAEAVKSVSKPTVQEPSGPRYAEIRPSMLETQMHQTLRITTVDKRKFEGVLIKTDADRAFISVPMGGGSATLPIKRRDITGLKVLVPATP